MLTDNFIDNTNFFLRATGQDTSNDSYILFLDESQDTFAVMYFDSNSLSMTAFAVSAAATPYNNIYESFPSPVSFTGRAGDTNEEDTVTWIFYMFNERDSDEDSAANGGAAGLKFAALYWHDTGSTSDAYLESSDDLKLTAPSRGYFLQVINFGRAATTLILRKTNANTFTPISGSLVVNRQSKGGFYKFSLQMSDSGSHRATIYNSLDSEITRLTAADADFLPTPYGDSIFTDTNGGVMLHFMVFDAAGRRTWQTDTWTYTLSHEADSPPAEVVAVPSSNRRGEKRIGDNIFIQNRHALAIGHD